VKNMFPPIVRLSPEQHRDHVRGLYASVVGRSSREPYGFTISEKSPEELINALKPPHTGFGVFNEGVLIA
jgi:hypothetical protein